MKRVIEKVARWNGGTEKRAKRKQEGRRQKSKRGNREEIEETEEKGVRKKTGRGKGESKKENK